MSEPLLLRRGLSLERLESFMRVAEAGSIVKAADRDPVRQSLYSRQIRELEEFFGAELIQRDGRGIRLTAMGKRLAQHAREQFAALRALQQEATHAPLTLTLGAGNSVLEWFITPLLPGLHRNLPAVQVTLLNRRTRDIVKDLQELKLDIGIAREDALTRGLKRMPLVDVAYGLFVPHRLVQRKEDVLTSLERLPLALAESESFQSQFAAAAQKARLAFQVAVNCSSFTQAAELVVGGEFAAVLPLAARRRLDERTCLVVTPSFLKACERRLFLAWNPRLAAVRPVIEQAVGFLRPAR